MPPLKQDEGYRSLKTEEDRIPYRFNDIPDTFLVRVIHRKTIENAAVFLMHAYTRFRRNRLSVQSRAAQGHTEAR